MVKINFITCDYMDEVNNDYGDEPNDLSDNDNKNGSDSDSNDDENDQKIKNLLGSKGNNNIINKKQKKSDKAKEFF